MGVTADDAAEPAFASGNGSAAIGAAEAVRALDYSSLVHGLTSLSKTFVLICSQYPPERPF